MTQDWEAVIEKLAREYKNELFTAEEITGPITDLVPHKVIDVHHAYKAGARAVLEQLLPAMGYGPHSAQIALEALDAALGEKE